MHFISEKSEYDFGQLCLFNEAELFFVSKTPERELVIISAQVNIREHVRNIYSCSHCEQREKGKWQMLQIVFSIAATADAS